MRSHSHATTRVWCFLAIAGVLWGVGARAVALDFAGPSPGKAAAETRDGLVCLENNILRMAWQISGGSLRPAMLEDKMARKTLALEKAECFQLILAKTPLPGTRTMRASDLKIVGEPQLQSIQANQRSLRLADRQPGRAIVVRLESADGALDVTWQAELREGSNYIRQRISCQPTRNEIELAEVVVWDLAVPGAEVCGIVDGSPVVAGNWFFAAEHPMSKSRLVDKAGRPGQPRFTCSYLVGKSLQPGQPRQFRSLVGVAPEGQLRRGFLYYSKRERAQPYRPFLHYNNGSEIGCEVLVPQTVRQARRGRGFPASPARTVALRHRRLRPRAGQRVARLSWTVSSMTMDGTIRTWSGSFTRDIPDGFRPAQRAAAKYGSHVGVWLSPFGGYAAPRSPHGIRTQTGVRNVPARADAGRPSLFRPFPRRLPGVDRSVRSELFQVRRFRSGEPSAGRPGLRQRRRGPARPDRPSAQQEARPVYQSEHGKLALAVLALVCRFDLAARFATPN